MTKLYSPWGALESDDTGCITHVPPVKRPANDNFPRVVAFAGLAGSGKSTAATYLAERHGYKRIRFAGPLKAMMYSLGFLSDEVEGKLKEEPNELLCGKSPRHAMQTLGTEWGRKCLGEDVWVNLWRQAANEVLSDGGRVVVDDCRFPNEAATVRKLGGKVWLIEGRGGIAGNHESERLDFVADGVIPNVGGLPDLHGAVLREVCRGQCAG